MPLIKGKYLKIIFRILAVPSLIILTSLALKKELDNFITNGAWIIPIVVIIIYAGVAWKDIKKLREALKE